MNDSINKLNTLELQLINMKERVEKVISEVNAESATPIEECKYMNALISDICFSVKMIRHSFKKQNGIEVTKEEDIKILRETFNQLDEMGEL